MHNKHLFHAIAAVFIGVVGGMLTATSYAIISAISAAGTGQGSTLFSLSSEEGTPLNAPLHAAAPSNTASIAVRHPMFLLILVSVVIAVCAFAIMKSEWKKQNNL